jgi:hypothetical protein
MVNKFAAFVTPYFLTFSSLAEDVFQARHHVFAGFIFERLDP